jgi:hypothetical protein
MARLQSIGFELNSATNGVEEKGFSGVVIGTTNVRSGTYAARDVDVSGTNYVLGQVYSSDQATIGYIRAYIYIVSLPSANSAIVGFATTAGVVLADITLKTDGTLQLKARNASNIGSASSVLSLNKWYSLELKYDASVATDTLEARLDGVTFASGNNSSNGDWGGYYIAGFSNSSARDLWFDDVAINDDSGSFQNSWPGEGKIIHLRPNAAGDTSEWTDGGFTNTYADVDEVTPNDATDSLDTHSGPSITHEFNIDSPTAIRSLDTINCVSVGVRHRTDASSTTAAFAVRIKAAASGTVESSANIVPNSTTWDTNASAGPYNYPLTLYDLPGGSTAAWTKADLETTQIGVESTVDDGLTDVEVSTLWLLVDYSAPTSLPEDTYYWRVRGKDTTGAWGEWTTARSFTIGSGGGGGGTQMVWPVLTNNKFWGPRFS